MPLLTHSRFVPVLLTVVLLTIGPSAHGALVVQSYDPQQHDRFNNSSQFIGNPWDWSGVGRSDTGAWAALISPSYVLSATHSPAAGMMRFYQTNDLNGPFVERQVMAGVAIAGSDLFLSRLSSPVGPEISFFPILDVASSNQLLGQTIYTFGLANLGTPQINQRLGRNTIDTVLPDFSHPDLGLSTGDVFTYDFDNPGGVGADESWLQDGDSAAPSFVIVNGEPAIVGIHWFTYTSNNSPEVGSGDTLVSSYIDELNAAMVGESVTIAAVPEPGGLLAGALGLAAVWAARRRRLSRHS